MAKKPKKAKAPQKSGSKSGEPGKTKPPALAISESRASREEKLRGQAAPRENAATPKYDKERREARYPVPFEIEVSGIDRNGSMFRQQARTHSVSTWGCGFLSATQLKKGDIISIRVLSGPGKETGFTPQLPFQVVYVQREGGGWSIGSVKMEEGEMWGADLKSLAHSHGFFSK